MPELDYVGGGDLQMEYEHLYSPNIFKILFLYTFHFHFTKITKGKTLEKGFKKC